MVEGVNSIQNKPIQKNKNNAAANAVVAGSLGAIGGGAAGYLTKQIYKDDKFTDEFIKQFRNEALDQACKDDASRKAVKAMINLKDNPSLDEVKNYISKYRNIFTDNVDDIDTFLKGANEEILNLFTSSKNLILDAIKEGEEILPNFYDKAKKCFNVPLDNSSNTDGLLAAIKAQQKIKGKAGLIWGATAGLVLGIGTYIVSKLSNNKQA